MNLDAAIPPDEDWERAPACSKPKSADAINAALQTDLRPVPATTVTGLCAWEVLGGAGCVKDRTIGGDWFRFMLLLASQVKQNKKLKTAAPEPERDDAFQGVSLAEIPMEARPLKDAVYKGKRSYTLHSASGAETFLCFSNCVFLVLGS